jgi:hypothetical protein
VQAASQIDAAATHRTDVRSTSLATIATFISELSNRVISMFPPE